MFFLSTLRMAIRQTYNSAADFTGCACTLENYASPTRNQKKLSTWKFQSRKTWQTFGRSAHSRHSKRDFFCGAFGKVDDQEFVGNRMGPIHVHEDDGFCIG